MIIGTNVIVVDIDGTLCPIKSPEQNYDELPVEPEMLQRLKELKVEGWHIVLSTARGMRTHQGNVGAITSTMLPKLICWLNAHGVPFDELHVGKPWPGVNGFYVDDRAVRPREFLSMDHEELTEICKRDRVATRNAKR